MTETPEASGLPPDYARFWHELKERIQAARVRAVLSVNREMIALYWDLGRQVMERQTKGSWGTGIIERLSRDIRAEFPGIKGFSIGNIWRMRAFYRAWPDLGPIWQRPVAKLDESILARPVRELEIRQYFTRESTILQRPIGELPWGHNIELLEKLKSPQDRLWYAEKSLEHGWPRPVLVHQIESKLHLRQGKALTNFQRTLPPAQSELAQAELKGEYALGFVATEPSKERDIEKGLLAHVQSFLLELGSGFAFVGRQHRLEVGGEDFYLDLLFYHLHLHCYIVIELKAGAFKPEHAGKMSFYLSAADDLLRRQGDGPTIGIILCRSKNKVVAEYALRDSNKPIGVSSYQLTKALPEKLRAELPALSEIERAAAATS